MFDAYKLALLAGLPTDEEFTPDQVISALELRLATICDDAKLEIIEELERYHEFNCAGEDNCICYLYLQRQGNDIAHHRKMVARLQK